MILTGTIIHGKGLGRKLGYRTANMHINPGSINLPSGTYAIKGSVRGKELKGVGVYIPEIETFESHFFDFDDDIYDIQIQVEPLYKIRENQRFDTLEALAEQIGKDIAYVQSVESSTTFIAIAAMAKNRIIGDNGKIPWYIPEDFKHFKETTLGYPIIMGRKTYESIGRPLPGRENIILSRTSDPIEGVTLIKTIPELQHYLYQKKIQQAFVCGGEQIYTSFFDNRLTKKVILSVVDMEPQGDTIFPIFEDKFELKNTEIRTGFVIQTWEIVPEQSTIHE